MSGTGKSSVVRELAARGFKAVDTDDGWSEPLPDGRQMWREDAIQALLATEDADVLSFCRQVCPGGIGPGRMRGVGLPPFSRGEGSEVCVAAIADACPGILLERWPVLLR
jgi:hypothetical protein